MDHSEFALKDVISSMPDNVVTHILDRLPLQDAVRTSILSRNWKFKWTMLSQPVFDEKFFVRLSKIKGESNCGRIITRFLLLLRGAITKFVLSIDEQCYSKLDAEDINHWIIFLSKNGIKDLTIWKRTGSPLMLPTHLFSCLELRHLKLFYCCFDPATVFHGFSNLLSLELDLVPFERGELGQFITRCPSLQTLNMRFRRPLVEIWSMDIFSVGEVKLVEIAKLANLKILSLSLCNLGNTMITSPRSIFELVAVLPNLQQLDLDFVKCKFVEGAAKKRFRAFPCLKALKLSSVDLGNGIVLSYIFEMIRHFLNLQTLEITATQCGATPTPKICSPEIDYGTMGLLLLRSVVLTDMKDSEKEVCFIKYILACSPLLKEISIRLNCRLTSDEKFTLATKLLKLHRASPVVDINLS